MLVFLAESASISPNARVVPVSPESGIPACSNLVLKPQPHRGLFLNFTAVRIASKFTEGGANDRCNVSHRSQTGSSSSFAETPHNGFFAPLFVSPATAKTPKTPCKTHFSKHSPT